MIQLLALSAVAALVGAVHLAEATVARWELPRATLRAAGKVELGIAGALGLIALVLGVLR